MNLISKIILLFISVAAPLLANSTGKDGLKNILPKDLIESERKSGKAILIYCYTSWCKPCEKMSQEVFNQKAVKDYLSENYHLYRVDMDSDEGKKIAKISDVTIYPTFLIIRKSIIESKFIGGYNTKDFLAKIKIKEDSSK